MEQVKAFLYRRRLWLVWLAAVAVCALALLWVRYDLADRVDNQPVYQIVNDDYARTVAIPAQGGLTQQISLQAGQRLYGVRLNLTNYEHAFATGVLHVALESPQGDTLTAGTMNCIDIRDNTFETIIFTEPYRAEDAAAVTLHIWYTGMDGADADLPLGLWASNIQVGNMALAAAGGPLDATAALQYVVDYSENWSGRMLLVPGMLILAAVAVSFWLLFGRTARHGCCQGNGTAGQANAVHIAGGVKQRPQVGLHPAEPGQRQRQNFDQTARLQPHRPQGKPPGIGRRPPVQIFAGDQQAEQHHRQIDGLGRPGQRSQRQQQQQLPRRCGPLPQRQTERRIAEHQPQNHGVGGKAARQLQSHGQQRRRGKQPFLPRMGQPHSQRGQQQIDQQVTQPPQCQHGKKAQPQQAGQGNAGHLAQI